MDFTFGIITTEGNIENINRIIQSIEDENIPNYEIIIVGGGNIERKNVVHIDFDEKMKHMWITKKKNLITQNAKYENIVYMHDYIELLPGWYDGHLKYGNDFHILMDKILNLDDTRFRDWTVWEVPLPNQSNRKHLPYDVTINKFMYFSGAYWVAKKNVMFEFPLDERFTWGTGEDVYWSKMIRNKYEFKMNINSSVKFLKYKENPHDYLTPDDIEKLKQL